MKTCTSRVIMNTQKLIANGRVRIPSSESQDRTKIYPILTIRITKPVPIGSACFQLSLMERRNVFVKVPS